MKRFAATATIRATPEKVWSLLINVGNWPRWNTTVTDVQGSVAVGKKVTVRVKLAPCQGFPVKVVTLDAPRKMVWRGGMPIGALFKGLPDRMCG